MYNMKYTLVKLVYYRHSEIDYCSYQNSNEIGPAFGNNNNRSLKKKNGTHLKEAIKQHVHQGFELPWLSLQEISILKPGFQDFIVYTEKSD